MRNKGKAEIYWLRLPGGRELKIHKRDGKEDPFWILVTDNGEEIASGSCPEANTLEELKVWSFLGVERELGDILSAIKKEI